jgi:hypothetical protein
MEYDPPPGPPFTGGPGPFAGDVFHCRNCKTSITYQYYGNVDPGLRLDMNPKGREEYPHANIWFGTY